MIYFVAFIAFVAGALMVFLIMRRSQKPVFQEEELEVVEPPEEVHQEVSIDDVIKLAIANNLPGIGLLMTECEVEKKLPVFYEKYQTWCKTNKEDYFQVLISILGKNKPEYMKNLIDNHPEISTQDILLLLMSNMEIDNKTMARIMISSLDTLKKRKTRLKIKIKELSLEEPETLVEQ